MNPGIPKLYSCTSIHIVQLGIGAVKISMSLDIINALDLMNALTFYCHCDSRCVFLLPNLSSLAICW